MFASVTTALLFRASASSSYSSLEPETGMLGSVTVEADQSASGNQFIQFGTSTTPLPLGDWPNENNTGFKAAGLSLNDLSSSGSLIIQENGKVISNQDISGCISVKANNVMIKNSRVICDQYHAIRLYDGYSGLIVENTEIMGTNEKCKAAVVFNNYTAKRLNVHGCADGLKAGSNTTIEFSYIHDLSSYAGQHNDGTQASSGNHIVIRNNNIQNLKAQTSCLMIKPDSGPINDVLIDSNLLNGGGYTVYTTRTTNTTTNVRVTNNAFGRDYTWGIFRNTNDYGTVDTVFNGNYWADTKEPINL